MSRIKQLQAYFYTKIYYLLKYLSRFSFSKILYCVYLTNKVNYKTFYYFYKGFYNAKYLFKIIKKITGTLISLFLYFFFNRLKHIKKRVFFQNLENSSVICCIINFRVKKTCIIEEESKIMLIVNLKF